MQSGHTYLFLAALVLCTIPPFSTLAEARQTSVTGSIGTGFDVRDRSYNAPYSGSTNDEQTISIKPTITVSSKGEYDLLSLQYSPSLKHEFVDDENTVDHFLNLKAQRMLSSRWSVSLSDRYKYTDDAGTSYATTEDGQTGGSEEVPDPEDNLSRDQTGRKYWTNAASIQSSYALYEKTVLNGGYTFSVLRNDQGSRGSDYDEYDKHAFSAGVGHEFNANWRSNVDTNVTRGLYKKEPGNTTANSDLYQYGFTAGVDYVDSISDFFPLQYSLSTTDYDANSRKDTTAHEWSVGWHHAFDPQTKLSFGGGPSYAVTEGQDGQLGYNAYFTFSKKYQHTSYSLQLSKKFETNNFSGTDESGLEDTYNARVNLAHQYSKDLGFNMFARYSRQSQIDPQGIYLTTVNGVTTQTTTGDNTYDKDIYEAGAGLRYAFGRWYSLGLRYSYYVSDGQLGSDQYDEHRVVVSLDMTKELFRW